MRVCVCWSNRAQVSSTVSLVVSDGTENRNSTVAAKADVQLITRELLASVSVAYYGERRSCSCLRNGSVDDGIPAKAGFRSENSLVAQGVELNVSIFERRGVNIGRKPTQPAESVRIYV